MTFIKKILYNSKVFSGVNVALIDNNKNIVSLNSVADLLGAKTRNLKIYEDKGLLPNKGENKLYTLNDVKKIAFVHYLAGINKVNANGIKFINKLMDEYMSKEEVDKLLSEIEIEFEKTPDKEIYEAESF